MLRCEEGQCDDMKAGLGQCVTSHNSINYFKFLLQKNAFCSSERIRRETQRRRDRFPAFRITNAKRVKPVSINVFHRYGEKRSENAFFSQKFTPWLEPNKLVLSFQQ